MYQGMICTKIICIENIHICIDYTHIQFVLNSAKERGLVEIYLTLSWDPRVTVFIGIIHSTNQYARNHLAHRFMYWYYLLYMNPIYAPYAYNGHARVVYITIPLHPNPSVVSKTHRIAPHRQNIRLPTRASPTYKNVGCNNIPRCSRRECSTNLKHPPEHAGDAFCKQKPASHLDLGVPKFLFVLP